MNGMGRTFGVAVVVVLMASGSLVAQGLPAAQAEAVGLSSARLARIDTVMQAYVDSSRVAGVAVLVLRDGRVVKSGAYGWADREAGRPLEEDALFRIASQTKAVTSVAVMMLVEEGRIRLADPVQRWVPSFADVTVAGDGAPTAAGRPITIRQLLTQTAGLSYGTDASLAAIYAPAGLGPAAGRGWYFADKEEPICASMDRLGTLPLLAEPGERFVYGYGTDLLGCVVERVSGRTLDEFFRERIFQPLGMNDSWFFVPTSETPRLTAVYTPGPDGLLRADDGPSGQGAYVDGPRLSYSGGAGLVMSIGDYARFLQMLLNGGELDGARILAPHTVALMTKDHLGPLYPQPGVGFGLGFEILEDPALAGRFGAPGAWGWGGAYATNYWVDPRERLVALIMAQMIPSSGMDAADRFRTLVYSAILEGAAPQQ